MSRRGLGTLLVGFTLLLGSCAGPRIEAVPQPFHLALVPFEVTRPAGSAAGDWSFDLRLEGDALAHEFARLLDGLCFSTVTLLELPAGVGAAEFARWPRAEQEAHWVLAARDARADVLFAAELRLVPAVRGDRTKLGVTAWDGLFKYGALVSGNLITAAFSALVTVNLWDNLDRDYRFDVGIEGTLQALGPLLDPASEAVPANRRAELLRVFVYDSDASLSFSQRAGFLGHVASFLVPAPFVPGKVRREHRQLREAIGEYLAKVFVQELEFRRAELLQGNDLFPYEVRAVALERGPERSHRLRCEFALDTTTIERMDGYRVWIDDVLVLDESCPDRPPGASTQELVLELPDLAPGQRVRLELRDDAVKQSVRTFTFVSGVTGRRASKPLEFHLPLPPEEAKSSNVHSSSSSAAASPP